MTPENENKLITAIVQVLGKLWELFDAAKKSIDKKR